MKVTSKNNISDKQLKKEIGNAKYQSLLSGFEVDVPSPIVKKYSHCFVSPEKGVKKNGDK